MRVPLMAGNWKMHKTPREAVAAVRAMAAGLPVPDDRVPQGAAAPTAAGVEVLICPPFPTLVPLQQAAAGAPIQLGGQDVHWEEKGAYTGAVAAPMLTEIGCTYAIVGHSERRRYFGDDDETAGKKAAAALRAGLRPILCVGEDGEERRQGETEARVLSQVDAALQALDTAEASGWAGELTIAYEPLWAIGTGQAASPDQAAAVMAAIRRHLEQQTAGAGAATRLLYGGSVKPHNVDGFMAAADIDGCLVGGASLTASSFVPLVESARPKGSGDSL